jgi:integrase
MSLNALKVTELLKDDAKPGFHLDDKGLYLSVGKGGARSWIYRFTLNGKTQDMGLGSAHALKLADAREERDKWAKVRTLGRNPIEVRKAERAVAVQAAAPAPKAVTFRDATTAWLEQKLRPELSSEKYSRHVGSTIECYCAPIADKPINDIADTDALVVLQPIWLTKNPTAVNLRRYCEAICDHAKALKHRVGENPFRWRGHLAILLPKPSAVHKKTPHAAVPWNEMPAFMAKLRKRDLLGARLTEFTILTAARTEESLFAKWPEIDWKERAWTCPPERMKGRKNKRTAHRVPLSTRALAILRELEKDRVGDFIFAHDDGRPFSTNVMDKTLESMGVVATAHGTARASFSTWRFEHEATAKEFDQELVEASLHHKLGSDTTLSYQRGKGFERRRKLMQAWADYCAGGKPGQ